MNLKTDYINDKFAGRRKYNQINNSDGTISLDDVTRYEQEGNIFSADDMNSTNRAINEAYTKIDNNTNKLNEKINDKTNELNEKITTNTTSIISIKKSVDVILKASSWSASAPYTQTVSVSGITSSSVPIAGLKYPATYTKQKKNEIDRCINMITDIDTQNGSVVFKCQFDKPTTELIITLKGD